MNVEKGKEREREKESPCVYERYRGEGGRKGWKRGREGGGERERESLCHQKCFSIHIDIHSTHDCHNLYTWLSCLYVHVHVRVHVCVCVCMCERGTRRQTGRRTDRQSAVYACVCYVCTALFISCIRRCSPFLFPFIFSGSGKPK